MSDKKTKTKAELLVEIDVLSARLLDTEIEEVSAKDRDKTKDKNDWNRWGLHPLDMNPKQLIEHIRLQREERLEKKRLEKKD